MLKHKLSSLSGAAAKSLAAAGLFFLELVKIALLALVTILLIRYYLFKPFYVKGASMEPNFKESEYLIIDEISYRFRAPERGEVIVFRYPENPKEYFLKRIIGLPGETVKVAEGRVYIYNQSHPEGLIISEEYLSGNLLTAGEKTTLLGQNQYFVMGDNRDFSYDARYWGFVSHEQIKGKAMFVWFSLIFPFGENPFKFRPGRIGTAIN